MTTFTVTNTGTGIPATAEARQSKLRRMTRKTCLFLVMLLALPPATALDRADVDATLKAHPAQTGTPVLERGE
jgi:hypothetical protein